MLTNEQLRELLTDLKQGQADNSFRQAEDLNRCAAQVSLIERMEAESYELARNIPSALAMADQASAATRDNLPKLKEIVRQMEEKIRQNEEVIQQCDDCLKVVDTGNNILANARYDQLIALARQYAGLDV